MLEMELIYLLTHLNRWVLRESRSGVSITAEYQHTKNQRIIYHVSDKWKHSVLLY
jgi:hypothetical protein